MTYIQPFPGHDQTLPAPELGRRVTLSDLTMGEMLAICSIAATPEARRAATILANGSDGVMAPNREAYMRIVTRGLARRDAAGYALTMRGQFLGAALIATIERQAR
jgi:hypothetical protein